MTDAVQNLQRLQRNVRRLIDAGAPETDIDAYLAEEGYTPDTFATANRRLAALGGAQVPEVGFGKRAANSALFNFGDEIAAGVSRLADYMTLDDKFAAEQPTYEQRLAANRMALDEYARVNPGKALAADITGGLAPAIATGGTLAAARGSTAALNAARASTTVRDAPTAFGLVKRAGLIGGAEGALGGVGAGEDAQGRAVGGLMGGTLGAGLGAGLSAGTSVLGAGKDLLTPTASMTAKNARRYFMNLINEEGESLAGASEELARRAALGVDDNIVADVMGPGFRSEMGGATTASTEFRREIDDLLNNRARQQADQVRVALSEATGGRVLNTAREAANLRAMANAQATPMYEAFRAGAPFVDDPALTAAMASRPSLSPALNAAQRNLADITGVPDPSGVRMVDEFRFDPKTLVLEPTQQPQLTITPTALQQTVQEMGASRADLGNPLLKSADKNRVAATLGARDALMSRMRELAEAGDERARNFINANALVSDAREYETMAAAGRGYMDVSSDIAEISLREARGASQTGQLGFQEGTLDALSQRLDESQNVAGRINQAVPRIADRRTMDRLLDVFPTLRGPDGAYGNLVQRLDALAQQSSTRNQFQGRQSRGATGSAVSEDAAMRFTAGEVASGLFQQNPAPALTGAAIRGLRAGDRAAQQEIRAAAAPFFLAQGSKNIEPYFDELARQRAADLTSDALARNVPGLAGGAAANATISSNLRGVSEALGVTENTAIGPTERDQVLEGIAQRERWINDPSTPPEERQKLIEGAERLRRLIGQ